MIPNNPPTEQQLLTIKEYLRPVAVKWGWPRFCFSMMVSSVNEALSVFERAVKGTPLQGPFQAVAHNFAMLVGEVAQGRGYELQEVMECIMEANRAQAAGGSRIIIPERDKLMH
jgi:hypothetical protein